MKNKAWDFTRKNMRRGRVGDEETKEGKTHTKKKQEIIETIMPKYCVSSYPLLEERKT
jgi:hypothetical protein